MDQHHYAKKQQGYVTLLTVLILGMVGLGIAVTLLFTGTGLLKTTLARQQSTAARALADACGETALLQIRNQTSFSGTSNLTQGDGTCSYTVIVGSGEARTINATGTVGVMVRKVKILLSAINPTVTISSWQEVSDF